MKKRIWFYFACFIVAAFWGCSDPHDPVGLAPNFMPFYFTFSVDFVEDEQGLLGGRVAPGTLGFGRYIYDLKAQDTTPEDSGLGYYPHFTPPNGIALEVGGFSIQSDWDDLDFWISLEDDVFIDDVQMDVYAVTSFNNRPLSSSAGVLAINWVLTSRFLDALGTTELTPVPPNLDDWNETNLLVVEGYDLNNEDVFFYFECTVTSIDLDSQFP